MALATPVVLSRFDLNAEQLLPIAAAVHGAPVDICQVTGITPLARDQGQCGDKVCLDLAYTAADGRVHSAPLFVKKFAWKGKSEAAHYNHLAAYQMPIPRLYGTTSHADGDEILFLERLTSIGFDRCSEGEWRQMLTLLAQFNACPVTEAYRPHLHPYEQGGKVDGWAITGFNFPPDRADIENNLRACGIEGDELFRLSGSALRLCEKVAALPQGLLHQDFLPDNFGWRGQRAEMVVFDLHKNGVGPRFADAAMYLAEPDWANTAAFLDETPERREALTRTYLSEYARYGGESVSVETFRQEASLLFWAHKVAILWWLAEQKQQERIDAVLDYLRSEAPTSPGE